MLNFQTDKSKSIKNGEQQKEITKKEIREFFVRLAKLMKKLDQNQEVNQNESA